MTSNKDTDFNVFILSWDMLGLETVINASQIEKEQMWNILKNGPTDKNKEGRVESVGQLVQRLMLRARFNTQRHYEIYSIRVDTSITVEHIKNLFEEHPQSAADLIRQRGTKLYSDRILDQKNIKIT